MTTNAATKSKRVWVVVLGDIGRSPRMQNHVKSFAENGHLVEVVGYNESRVNQVRKFKKKCLRNLTNFVPVSQLYLGNHIRSEDKYQQNDAIS